MSSKNDLSGGCSESFSVNNTHIVHNTHNEVNFKYKFSPHTITFIVGRRGCGKTSFIINKIYRDICHTIDNLYVVSTKSAINEHRLYQQITNNIFDTDDFEYVFSSIIKKSKENQNNLLIFDSACLYESKNKNILEKIIPFLHQYKLTIIVSLSTLMPYKKYKDCIDHCIFSVSDLLYSKSDIKSAYDLFFGIFPNLNDFINFLEKGNKGQYYNFVISNKTAMTNNIDDAVFITRTELYDAHKKILFDRTLETTELKEKFIFDEQQLILKEFNDTIEKLITLRNRLKKVMKN
jgi:hypothetical protein